MKFILATWEDVYRQPFHVELFPGELSSIDVIDYLSHQRTDSEFNRKVLSRTDTSAFFDDGTSLELQLVPLQKLEPKYWFIEPLQLESANASSEIEIGECSPESMQPISEG